MIVMPSKSYAHRDALTAKFGWQWVMDHHYDEVLGDPEPAGHTLYVRSGSGRGEYAVTLRENGHHTCGCADFQFRGRMTGMCKHIREALALERPVDNEACYAQRERDGIVLYAKRDGHAVQRAPDTEEGLRETKDMAEVLLRCWKEMR